MISKLKSRLRSRRSTNQQTEQKNQLSDVSGTFTIEPKFELIARCCNQCSSEKEQKLLVDGYVHQNTSSFIPIEIIYLFIEMIGKHTDTEFKWFIEGNDLQKALSNANSTNIHIEKATFEVFELKPFKLSASIDSFCIKFKLSVPPAPKAATQLLSGRIDLFQYMSVLYCIETANKVIDARDRCLEIPLAKLNILSSLNIGCKIDIINIAKHYKDTAELGYYFNNYTMKDDFMAEWPLLKSYLPANYKWSNKKNMIHSEIYYSTPFNNHWIFIFERLINKNQQDQNKLKFYFKCMLIPFPVTMIQIYARFSITIKDILCETKRFSKNITWSDNESTPIIINEHDHFSDDTFNLNCIKLTVHLSIDGIATNYYYIEHRNDWPLYGINIVNNELNKQKKDIDIKLRLNKLFHKEIIISNGGKIDLYSTMITKRLNIIKNEFNEKYNKQQKEFQEQITQLQKQLNLNGNNNIIQYKINKDTAKEVEKWLKSFGFEMYFDIFVENGFDSLQFIKEINNKNDLKDIGITLIAHQLKIINQIHKLNNL